jgi:hypothetical protein
VEQGFGFAQPKEMPSALREGVSLEFLLKN